jgi:hypothetical protein
MIDCPANLDGQYQSYETEKDELEVLTIHTIFEILPLHGLTLSLPPLLALLSTPDPEPERMKDLRESDGSPKDSIRMDDDLPIRVEAKSGPVC